MATKPHEAAGEDGADLLEVWREVFRRVGPGRSNHYSLANVIAPVKQPAKTVASRSRAKKEETRRNFVRDDMRDPSSDSEGCLFSKDNTMPTVNHPAPLDEESNATATDSRPVDGDLDGSRSLGSGQVAKDLAIDSSGARRKAQQGSEQSRLRESGIDRVMRDVREQEQKSRALYRSDPHFAALDRIQRQTDPFMDYPLSSDKLLQHGQLTDDVLRRSALNSIGEKMAMLNKQSRYFDSLLDCNSVGGMTAAGVENLMRQPGMLPNPDRRIQDQVDSAATLRISQHWGGVDQTHADANTIALATAFTRDPFAMASAASGMQSIYGPTVAEQTRLLAEFQVNVGPFESGGLTALAYERTEILARIARKGSFATGFDGYEPVHVERMQWNARDMLRELEADFNRDRNPVHVFEALALALRHEISMPEWVKKYLGDTADLILNIRKEVAAGKPVFREAERVGKALGFGTEGPGRSGWFKQATMLERDRAIYCGVVDELGLGNQLDHAYDNLSKFQKVSRSTIVRAYLRITRLNGEIGDESHYEEVS